MFKRGGHVLPSAWPVPLISIPKGFYSLWPRKKAAKKHNNSSLSLSRKRAFFVAPIWLATLLWVWSWWFAAGRADLLWLYIPLSAALFYEFAFLPSAFLFFVLKSKSPPVRRLLQGRKVALITPCVPASESTEVIERQLKAMSEVEYPHDSWILDEGGDIEIKKLAKKYGVKYFTRKGKDKYNQADYPFKAKTKAGNVNAWLRHTKRYKYEFFVQLDIDHAPKRNYLHKTIGQFRDENVAWVQPPSVYSNTDNWIARGATEMDFAFQGPLQMGFYGYSETPMIVGSHCVYRMSAVNEMGGFQPTRAEDHLDTLVLTSNGWKGVFIPEVIAEGDGPESFSVFLAQQFAWSYSMLQILLRFSPKYLPKIPKNKLFPFIFSETFYPLWSLSYLLMFLAPMIALALNRDIVKIHPFDILVHLVPAFIVTVMIYVVGRPLMQPKNVSLSWRGIILQTIRWPVVMMAMINALFKVQKPYMITPKGKAVDSAPPVRLYMPFLVLGFISTAVSIYATIKYGSKLTSGQMLFTLFNAFFMTAICVLDINISMRKTVTGFRNLSMDWLKPAAAIATLVMLISLAVVSSPLLQKSTAEALVGKVALDEPKPSEIPIYLLSNEQLIQQIRSYSNPSSKYQSVSVGVHDSKHYYNPGVPYIRHSFIDWRNPRDLSVEILRSERLGAVPLVTIEPDGVADGNTLLQDIVDGKYDQNILDIGGVLQNVKRPVYVRFAHEMDLDNVYPWGGQDPQLFIAAYQHTISLVRTQSTPYVRWVWSPAGNQGVTEAYYPGDNYVDVIGTTVLYDKYWSGEYKPNFEQLSSVRRWLSTYNKPVWITELGIGNADPSFQSQLLGDAVAHYKDYGFSALVYLNIPDANLETPNYTFNDNDQMRKILGITPDEAMATNKLPLSENNASSDKHSRAIAQNKSSSSVPHLWEIKKADLSLGSVPKQTEGTKTLNLSKAGPNSIIRRWQNLNNRPKKNSNKIYIHQDIRTLDSLLNK